MLMSCDCRQRLGLTVSGAAASSVMKPYCPGFQIVLPASPVMTSDGSGAMSPLRAFSKSLVSSNGSSCFSASFASFVASLASLRVSWSCARAGWATNAARSAT